MTIIWSDLKEKNYLELSVHSFCPWNSLSVSTCGQKKTNCTIRVLIETSTEEDKSDMAFGSVRVFCYSESGGLQLLSDFFSSDPRCWLLVDLSSDLLQ